MRFLFCLSLVLLGGFSVSGQEPVFTIDEITPMIEPVANNAVVSATCGDTLCVYSFCGIDSTKTPSGIHLKAWRYNTVSEAWSQLPDVPDDTGNGKIAAGASVVDNKIYVIGGYYVSDNFSEESSDDVHVFNPETNEWEEDGAAIPVPIDDHVQAVWNESLIYVVTGWSDNQNVPDVQIYNPETDTWMAGTSTPNNSDYKVFGGSGEIIGNQIFYHGGVRSSFGFYPTTEVRRGIIDPLNPESIEWEILGDSEFGATYRAAAISIPQSNSIFWIGGSVLGYNFDGIDYNGTGGVEAADRIVGHNIYGENLTYSPTVDNTSDYVIPMDLRGIARVSSIEEEEQTGVHSSIICGGMISTQEVSDRAFLITTTGINSVMEEVSDSQINLSWSGTELTVKAEEKIQTIYLFDMSGKMIHEAFSRSESVHIETSSFEKGIYFAQVVLVSHKSIGLRVLLD